MERDISVSTRAPPTSIFLPRALPIPAVDERVSQEDVGKVCHRVNGKSERKSERSRTGGATDNKHMSSSKRLDRSNSTPDEFQQGADDDRRQHYCLQAEAFQDRHLNGMRCS